jgi:Sec-independent protein secretion pathway component TatC
MTFIAWLQPPLGCALGDV